MTLSARTYDPIYALGGKVGNFVNPGNPAITQATNRSTGVTVNTLSGLITTNTASLAAEAAATFTVTNNTVAADDVVVVSIAGGSNGGNTSANVTTISAGSFAITVSNNNPSAGTAETGAILINFLVFKASQTY